MCGVPEHSDSVGECAINACLASDGGMRFKMCDTVGNLEPSFSLLELAANNDLAGFKTAVEEHCAEVEDSGRWYCRQHLSNQMVWSERTPAMIASLYGSLDVLRYILNHISTYGGNIDKGCGSDGSTALHCAAAGGSTYVLLTVSLLLRNGADPTVVDAQGLRPSDVIKVSPRLPALKLTLGKILNGSLDFGSPLVRGLCSTGSAVRELDGCPSGSDFCHLEAAAADLDDVIGLDLVDDTGEVDPILSSSFSSSLSGSTFSPFSLSPASSPKWPGSSSSMKALMDTPEKMRDYPVDPTLPDIKNIIYSTDEFRMFSFKVRPCSRAYSHDWTECPFVHPGENARRRDPRRYHYSCVPCPDFRKGACRRGDACEYAHGVFESWLHPVQYRTRLCKDGTSCARRVCFFAHTTEELRPLFVSTGSGVPSPRTTLTMDANSMSPPLGPVSPGVDPVSPSSVLIMPPFSPSNRPHTCPSTSLMSPSSVNSLSGTWTQPSVPTLHLSGVGHQASRLRAAVSARDIPLEELSRPSDFEGKLISEIASLSTQARLNAAVASSGCGTTPIRAGKYWNIGLNVAPKNLEDLFASNFLTSPRSPSQACLQQTQFGTHGQGHKPTHPQFQSQLQSQREDELLLASCVQMQSMKSVSGSSLQGQFLPQSAERPSFRSAPLRNRPCIESEVPLQVSTGSLLSPVGTAARAVLAQQDKRSHSSKHLAVLSDWGSPTGKLEWGVHGDDLSKFRKSASFKLKTMEEPDFSWVQKSVKDGPFDGDLNSSMASVEMACNGSTDMVDHSMLGSWIERLRLDQTVA